MNGKRMFLTGSLAVLGIAGLLMLAPGRGVDAKPVKSEKVAAEKGDVKGEMRAAAEKAMPAFAMPEGATHVGQAIEIAEPVRLAAVKKDPEAYFDKTILVEADASAVCQSKGCWLTISDGEDAGDPIWVRWASGCGGKYAFPKDLAGQRILIQGSFYEKEIAPADAEHLAAESKDLKAEDIVGRTFEMNATACVILPAEAEKTGA